MTRGRNHDDASSKKTIKTCDKSGVASWSDLNHDVLFLVMMRLGIVDYLALGGVCKSWRSLALSNRNKFIASRPPMSISISNDANEKACYLEDFFGRKFKTTLPHSADRTCIGLTCGYLILYGEKIRDFWLVNPITRHELHFPDVPSEVLRRCAGVRVILVLSISVWVFVMLNKITNEIWFSITGEGEWTNVSTPFFIHDLHAFKGKIYVLHSLYGLYEVILHPKPKLALLETTNFPKSGFSYPKFASSGENLFVIDRGSEHPYKIHELDFGEMKWVSREKTGKEYAFFLSNWKHHVVVLPKSWDDISSQYKRYVRYVHTDKLFYAKMWYIFHDCTSTNLIHEW